jgi:hypothetical protein
MKKQKVKLNDKPIQYVSNITFDKRLEILRTQLAPAPKYEELNKLVANLDLTL